MTSKAENPPMMTPIFFISRILLRRPSLPFTVVMVVVVVHGLERRRERSAATPKWFFWHLFGFLGIQCHARSVRCELYIRNCLCLSMYLCLTDHRDRAQAHGCLFLLRLPFLPTFAATRCFAPTHKLHFHLVNYIYTFYSVNCTALSCRSVCVCVFWF